MSFFGGMLSSSPTAATAGTLAHPGAITARVAALGVVLSSVASALVLLPLVVRAARGTALGRRVLVAAGLMCLAAATGLAPNPWSPPCSGRGGTADHR